MKSTVLDVIKIIIVIILICVSIYFIIELGKTGYKIQLTNNSWCKINGYDRYTITQDCIPSGRSCRIVQSEWCIDYNNVYHLVMPDGNNGFYKTDVNYVVVGK